MVASLVPLQGRMITGGALCLIFSWDELVGDLQGSVRD